MSPRKSRCDIPNGTTQGWVGPYTVNNLEEFYFFDFIFWYGMFVLLLKLSIKDILLQIFQISLLLQVYFFYMYVCILDLLFFIGYGPMSNCFKF
jgi:hypothetical protein